MFSSMWRDDATTCRDRPAEHVVLITSANRQHVWKEVYSLGQSSFWKCWQSTRGISTGWQHHKGLQLYVVTVILQLVNRAHNWAGGIVLSPCHVSLSLLFNDCGWGTNEAEEVPQMRTLSQGTSVLRSALMSYKWCESASTAFSTQFNTYLCNCRSNWRTLFWKMYVKKIAGIGKHNLLYL